MFYKWIICPVKLFCFFCFFTFKEIFYAVLVYSVLYFHEGPSCSPIPDSFRFSSPCISPPTNKQTNILLSDVAERFCVSKMAKRFYMSTAWMLHRPLAGSTSAGWYHTSYSLIVRLFQWFHGAYHTCSLHITRHQIQALFIEPNQKKNKYINEQRESSMSQQREVTFLRNRVSYFNRLRCSCQESEASVKVVVLIWRLLSIDFLTFIFCNITRSFKENIFCTCSPVFLCWIYLS